MLQRLEELCPGRPEAIRQEDWKALKGLPSLSALNVEQLFYPSAPLDSIVDNEAKGSQYRSPKLLTTLTDTEYHAAYNSIQRATTAVDTAGFPDIEAVLNRGRKEGPILSQVMSQIARWINPKPADVDPRKNSKPPHWRDFMPALEDVAPEEAERVARQLQRDIFDVVRGRWDELDGILEGDISQSAYVARFNSLIWHDLLVLVHKAVGPRFVGKMARCNTRLPKRPSSDPKPALIRSIGEAIRDHPQVSRNPALRTPAAITQLMGRISPLIAEWAVDLCDQGLKAQADERTPQWPPSVLKQVEEERLAMSELTQATIAPVQAHVTLEDGSSPRRATAVVESGSTPIEISPEPLVVSSPPRSPARQVTARPVPQSNTISGLLTPDAETIMARRKALRDSRPRLPKFSPLVASQRPPLVTPSRIYSPATTTTPRALPWTSGPVARPYRENV
jgi:hypothetical protein